MTVVVLLAVGVPGLFCLLVWWRWSNGLPADRPGLALQTVIIIVVLLIIAGAVSTVLVVSGGRSREMLQRNTNQTMARRVGEQAYRQYYQKPICERHGFSWAPLPENQWAAETWYPPGYNWLLEGQVSSRIILRTGHCRPGNR